MAEHFRGGAGPERKFPGSARGPLGSVPGLGRGAVAARGPGLPGGRQEGGRAPDPGHAAMNLERLRKRVRQYLDQVGGRSGERGPGLGRQQGRLLSGSWRRAVLRAWALVRGKAPEGRGRAPRPLQPGG